MIRINYQKFPYPLRLIIYDIIPFPDFRNYMSKSFPSVLNGFYYIGEKFGDSRIRQIDQAIWTAGDKTKTGEK